MIIAAADGSSLSNPGPAGWAWFVDGDTWAAGGWPHGTNNMGELKAVLDLLEQTAEADDDLLILCDSQYVINSVTKWMPGWKRKGWKKADGKPVQNVDLLQAIDAALPGRRVTFEWVKGHAGHELNEAADARARAAATAYQQRQPVNAGPGFPGTPAASAASCTPEAAPAPVPAAEPDLFSEAEAATEHPAIASQRRWLSDELRGDRDAAAELLHPRFTGVDTRGVSSGKGRILASLAPFPDPVSMEIDGVEELAPWVVLVRWHARSRSAVSAHASVWVKQGDAWRLRFDQATATTR
ncbi:ribonuclease HI family protein [Propioniciclava flava]|uniref:Ribonuclease H n=1 Tax=Propioniciclava flava TaxID=2072026 RepID=A0A4Q2EF61_9ACTN|nr:ribonuclease HI family protein [Propioniciclava flava]RXW32240.1 DUF4440 domain-containing protein [Propioniciclava flava]